MLYTEFQNQESSEKITLAVVEASKRLMGWTVHSGSVYKLTGFDVASIVSIEDSGTAYTEVGSVGAVTAGKFYNDRTNLTIYIRTSISDNPNGRFIVLTKRLFFSTSPVTLAHDMASGSEVYWEPMISSTSSFGVEIDTVNQTGEAIEGAGSLSLHNDHEFWPENFDSLFFENQRCYIYSYNRDLDSASEAKLLFQGRIEKKSYSERTIQFQLKDQLSELRAPVSLSNIEDLGDRTNPALDKAKQRMIFGRIFGHRPVNTDEVLTGYPISGTVSVSVAGTTVTGSSTAFLSWFSPDDEILLGGEKYTIATVISDTSLTLTEAYSGTTALSGATAYIVPKVSKRRINRTWLVAGHALKEPVATAANGCTVTKIYVDSTSGFFAGDDIYIGSLGSGELATISRVVNSTLLELSTSLTTAPSVGTSIRRPAVQNVRINDMKLTYYRDYTLDASTAVITLRNTAEENAAPVRQMSSNLVFTNGSRTVTGTGLDKILASDYVIAASGQSAYFEVLSVDSSTQVTLRSPSTYTATATGLYKSLVFDNSKDVLSCDVLGRTTDGTTTGSLIRKASDAVKQLLTDAGLSAYIDTASFTDAADLAGQDIGIVIPSTYSDQTAPTYRDVINKLNKSVFGNLVQTQAFDLSYVIIRPSKSSSALKLREYDVLDLSVTATAENMVKTAIVRYLPKEYNYLTGKESIGIQQTTSDTSTYILKTTREKTFESYLVEEADAERLAARWALILENSSGVIRLKTKLQGASIEVGDLIDVEHRKLFTRFGGTDKRRIVLVEKITKDGFNVNIEAVDLGNLFNRVSAITSSTADYATATDEEKIYGGFLTDSYGMMSNDPDTFGMNIIF
jgi:hypothetical protein